MAATGNELFNNRQSDLADMAEEPANQSNDRDVAMHTFNLVKEKVANMDIEDRLRFNAMLTAFASDFEKDIIRSLEKAFNYLDPQSYDALRQRIVNHLIVIGSASRQGNPVAVDRSQSDQPSARKRKRQTADDDDAGPSAAKHDDENQTVKKKVIVPEDWTEGDKKLTIAQMLQIFKNHGVKGCHRTDGKDKLRDEINKLKKRLHDGRGNEEHREPERKEESSSDGDE